MAKGADARGRIERTLETLRNGNSGFWDGFRESLRQSTAEQEDKDASDIRVLLDDFSVSYPTDDSIVRFLLELLFQRRAVFRGDLTLDVEGAVSWPLPDPDLVFRWEVEAELVDSDSAVLFSCLIRFRHVEGPGLGWVLGILGFLVGGPIGFVAGLGVGEIIDLQYENPGREGEVIRELRSIYDGSDAVIIEGLELAISRPDDRSFKLSMKVVHVESAFKGLFVG
jgi:hypothetical protein